MKKDDIRELLPKRAEQAKTPKIIIGGMNKRLECFLDSKGEYLAGKSTVIVTKSQIPNEILLGLLNSKLLSFCYKNMSQALSLAGGFMRVGPPQIRLLPIKTPSPNTSKLIKEYVDELTDLNQKLFKVDEESERGMALRAEDQT